MTDPRPPEAPIAEAEAVSHRAMTALMRGHDAGLLTYADAPVYLDEPSQRAALLARFPHLRLDPNDRSKRFVITVNGRVLLPGEHEAPALVFGLALGRGRPDVAAGLVYRRSLLADPADLPEWVPEEERPAA